MPILHVITKTESGYALRVWEPAETTVDRVRPFLWEINLNAASADEFGLILEQLDLLHKCEDRKLEIVPLSSQDLTKIKLSESFSEAIESDDCITVGLSAQTLKTCKSTPTSHAETSTR
jgi:hypothetical protein